MYDWQCCESKEGIKDSYTQTNWTQKCILKAKEGIKVGTGRASEGNEGWLWSAPKIRQPNSVYLMRERRSNRDSNVMDACWRWNIGAVHLMYLKIKSTTSMGVIDNYVWEVWIYGNRNHDPGQPIKLFLYQKQNYEERKNTGNVNEPQEEKKKWNIQGKFVHFAITVHRMTV